jgi:hypothetical protein
MKKFLPATKFSQANGLTKYFETVAGNLEQELAKMHEEFEAALKTCDTKEKQLEYVRRLKEDDALPEEIRKIFEQVENILKDKQNEEV